MTFDARCSVDEWRRGFLVGKLNFFNRTSRNQFQDVTSLMTKHYFRGALTLNRISDCSHPWHLIRKIFSYFLFARTKAKFLHHVTDCRLFDFSAVLSSLPALFPFHSDLFRFVRSCSRLLFLSCSLVLQFDFTLSWIKNMIASIAIRSRFIGFMLALIVFYGLFRN